ncbi:hypothetical protein Goshw_028589 [Gossypium schwendimanii]|uniref:Uncharacterized protein n=1 Tax=Gossypium schwendimanii TaxID=34291 RepID=A0A7J9LS68_GOSSC|nr:hypothetical protein [Gossypium schwendimanii]
MEKKSCSAVKTRLRYLRNTSRRCDVTCFLVTISPLLSKGCVCPRCRDADLRVVENMEKSMSKVELSKEMRTSPPCSLEIVGKARLRSIISNCC